MVPEISVSPSVTSLISGETLVVTGYVDDELDEDHILTVDWGIDGNLVEVPLTIQEGRFEFSASNRYTIPGRYQINLEVEDGRGYVSTESIEVLVDYLAMDIDIKDMEDGNLVPIFSKGVLPITIFGGDIRVESLIPEEIYVNNPMCRPIRYTIADTNLDGLSDYCMFVKVSELNLLLDDETLSVMGILDDGRYVKGNCEIMVLDKKKY